MEGGWEGAGQQDTWSLVVGQRRATTNGVQGTGSISEARPHDEGPRMGRRRGESHSLSTATSRGRVAPGPDARPLGCVSRLRPSLDAQASESPSLPSVSHLCRGWGGHTCLRDDRRKERSLRVRSLRRCPAHTVGPTGYYLEDDLDQELANLFYKGQRLS